MLKFLNANKLSFWIGMAIIPIALLLISHFVFVKWLYMRPCTECVYIRFAFFLCAIFFLWAIVLYRTHYIRYVISAMSCGAILYGMQHSIALMSTESLGSCAYSAEPFTLYGFETLFPTLFKPTGECGFTAPLPPTGVSFDGLQGYLINLYTQADGWYLIPQWHFGSMAGSTFVILFGLLVLVTYAEFQAHILRKGRG